MRARHCADWVSRGESDDPPPLARTLERRQLVRERNRYREEMEALAVALRGTTDGVAIFDPLGRISFVNGALAAGLARLAIEDGAVLDPEGTDRRRQA